MQSSSCMSDKVLGIVHLLHPTCCPQICNEFSNQTPPLCEAYLAQGPVLLLQPREHRPPMGSGCPEWHSDAWHLAALPPLIIILVPSDVLQKGQPKSSSRIVNRAVGIVACPLYCVQLKGPHIGVAMESKSTGTSFPASLLLFPAWRLLAKSWRVAGRPSYRPVPFPASHAVVEGWVHRSVLRPPEQVSTRPFGHGRAEGTAQDWQDRHRMMLQADATRAREGLGPSGDLTISKDGRKRKVVRMRLCC